jgi:hypothetical protein
MAIKSRTFSGKARQAHYSRNARLGSNKDWIFFRYTQFGIATID